jgi:hypothetical protein
VIVLPDVVLDVVLREKLSLPDEVPAMLKEKSSLSDVLLDGVPTVLKTRTPLPDVVPTMLKEITHPV